MTKTNRTTTCFEVTKFEDILFKLPSAMIDGSTSCEDVYLVLLLKALNFFGASSQEYSSDLKISNFHSLVPLLCSNRVLGQTDVVSTVLCNGSKYLTTLIFHTCNLHGTLWPLK